MTKITADSRALLQATNNLALENIIVKEFVANKAIATVNEGIQLTPSIIKEVVNSGKI